MINHFRPIFVLLIALSIDILFGEPKTKCHPVALIGKVVELTFYRVKLRKKFEKIYGIFAAFLLASSISFLVFQTLETMKLYDILIIPISALILKFTFSIRSLKEHVYEVIRELEKKNLEEARVKLAKIVSRDTRNLNEKQIISATIESASESLVDGIVSPIFYFGAIFLLTKSIPISVSSAVFFKIANTLDSMIGYKNERFIDLGWFSAKLDTFLNFVPSRLVIFLFFNKKALKTALRDHKKTESLNAGFPMSAMAGYLNVQLEKLPDKLTGKMGYKLGDDDEKLNLGKVKKAWRKVKIITAIFISLVVLTFIFFDNSFH